MPHLILSVICVSFYTLYAKNLSEKQVKTSNFLMYLNHKVSPFGYEIPNRSNPFAQIRREYMVIFLLVSFSFLVEMIFSLGAFMLSLLAVLTCISCVFRGATYINNDQASRYIPSNGYYASNQQVRATSITHGSTCLVDHWSVSSHLVLFSGISCIIALLRN